MKKKLIIFGIVAVLAIAVFMVYDYFSIANAEIRQIREDITVQAGEMLSMNPSDYVHASNRVLKECTVDAKGVRTEDVGDYVMVVKFRNRLFDIRVHVEDSKAPTITVDNNKIKIPVNTTLSMHDLPIKIEDISPYQCHFANGTEAIHYDKIGTYKETVSAVDHYLNTARLEIEIEVIDVNPPVISGVKNYNVYQGTPVNAMAGVTATDIEDGDLTSKIEVSEYNTNQIGDFHITYKVKDVYGNETIATANLVVSKKPEPTVKR